MSELKDYKMVDEKYCTDCVCVIPSEVYLKSEADKVFAELEERHKMEVEQLLIEIAELQKQVRDYAQGLYVIQARAEKEARHHKYKRCLAMARWCERKRIDAANYRIPRQKWDFYDKWHKRWLELAERIHPNVRILRFFHLEKKNNFFSRTY